jgi:hypothetical protein
MGQASFEFASESEALAAAMSAVRFLAEADAAQRPVSVTADCLRALERLDSVAAAVRGKLLWYFDLDHGYEADGQGGVGNWLRQVTRVTKGQKDAHVGLMKDRETHRPFERGLLGGFLSVSVARLLGKITARIEDDKDRAWTDECLVTAAESGASEHGWPPSAAR